MDRLYYSACGCDTDYNVVSVNNLHSKVGQWAGFQLGGSPRSQLYLFSVKDRRSLMILPVTRMKIAGAELMLGFQRLTEEHITYDNRLILSVTLLTCTRECWISAGFWLDYDGTRN